MRRVRVPLVTCGLILVIAACAKRDPVANGANAVTAVPAPANESVPTPAGAPPENVAAPAAPAPASAAATPIPAALQGRWGLTPADCTSPLGDAKGLLIVSGGELRFYESRAVPSAGVQTDSLSISGNFSFTGEGQSWTKYETFERQKDKLVRTETNPAASYTYAKC
jgi:hypothetical protein